MNNKLNYWQSRTFWKIISFNILIVVSLFLILTFSSRDVLSNHSEQLYQSLTEDTTAKVQNQLTNVMLDVKKIASRIKEDEIILNGVHEQLEKQLKAIIEYSPYLDGGTIVDQKGIVQVAYPEGIKTKDLSNREYVKQALETKLTYLGNYINTNGRDLFVISIPIEDNQNVVKVVNLSIHLKENEFFNSIMGDLEIADDSYIYVIDKFGKVLFHPNPGQIGVDASNAPITKRIIELSTSSIPRGMYNAPTAPITTSLMTNGYERITDINEESYYVSYHHVQGMNWGIIAVVPVKSVFFASNQLLVVLVPIFLILSIVLFFIITNMMRSTLKPYGKLLRGIDNLVNLKAAAPITDVDEKSEIGPVIAKYNVLVGELQQYKTDNLTKTKEIQRQHNYLNRIINYSPSAIYVMNWSGEYTIVNQAFADMFGLTPEDIIGKKEIEINSDIQEAMINLKVNREVIQRKEEKEIEDSFIEEDGNKRWFHVGKVPITGADGETQVLTVGTDISDRKQQEEVIKHQAYHDDLTGMPNRKLFKEQLADQVENARENNQAFAVLFLDLDRFKYINDTFGHDAGDSLLKMVSERFKKSLPKNNVVYRLGGDEFTIIIPGLGERQEVAEISKGLLASLSAPYEFNEDRFIITASIGIAIYPNDSLDADALLKHADIAMYQAKEQGKNTFRFYAPHMETEVASKLRLEMDLYQALEREELFIQYQPLVATENECLAGVEALIRWEHPILGLISPAEFIPIAEETGLIHAIGEWVLKTACMETKRWEEAGEEPIKLSVNLSPVQLKSPILVETVEKILEEANLEPERLELEITESTIMENKREVVKIIKQLRNLGVRIAIDDFGTGYSSLNSLKRLPIDTLKIDRSLVEHLLEGEVDDVILSAVFDIAKKLNLTVVAEGIETDEQFNYVKEKYCQLAQGFLFSQPLTDEELLEFLRRQSV